MVDFVSVRVGTPAIKRMLDKIANPAAVSDQLADAWTLLYQSFVRKRFATYSRGGGNWKPLKPSTIARRRKGRGQGSPAILRDTGALFAALMPAVSGGVLQRSVKTFGMKIFVGGGGTHAGSQITLAKLIAIHHKGLGNVPARKIVVKPDGPTTTKMANVTKKIVGRALKEQLG